jgi:uncharacterized membrane protein YphA (DoxX/SURF4 family)
MNTAATNYVNQAPGRAGTQLQQVTSLLKWTYGLVPIAAGVDKFIYLLTDWDKYLAPVVTNIIPLSANTFMHIVGVIEIVAGILVLVKPRIGSLVVGFWLLGIVVNLLLTGQYFDIAVRDTVMAIGAFSLYMLLNSNSDMNNS